MKRGVICLFTVLFALFTVSKAPAQQFPIGLYSGADSNTAIGYLTDIHSLGANMVVYPVRMTSNPGAESGQFQNIIPLNAYSPNDKVYYYSGGYWSTWTPKNKWDTAQGGDEALILRKEFGTIENEVVNSNTFQVANTQTDFASNSDFFLTGPGYKQDYIYSRNKRGYDVNQYSTPPNLINYKIDFTMKLGGATAHNGEGTGDAGKICEIYVYRDDIEILKQEVFDTDFPADQPGGYSIIHLNDPVRGSTYNYSSKITQAENGPNLVGPKGRPNPAPAKETYSTIQFKVKWFGHRQLFVKQVDVYDDHIGIQLKNSYTDSKNAIENYLNGTNGISHFVDYTNISNWYSLDEPSTLDSYKPYNLVNEIVKGSIVDQHVQKPLITAFSPYFNKESQYQGNRTFPRWIKDAKPDILLFDF